MNLGLSITIWENESICNNSCFIAMPVEHLLNIVLNWSDCWLSLRLNEFKMKASLPDVRFWESLFWRVSGGCLELDHPDSLQTVEISKDFSTKLWSASRINNAEKSRIFPDCHLDLHICPNPDCGQATILALSLWLSLCLHAKRLFSCNIGP